MNDFTPEELRLMGTLRDAAKTLPDLCAVEALQEFVGIFLKVEPLLPEAMRATLFGIGAIIAAQAEKEMQAAAQAFMEISKARKA